MTSIRRAVSVALLLLSAGCAGPERSPGPPPAEPQPAPAGAAPAGVDALRDRLRAVGAFEADLTLVDARGLRLGQVALASDPRGPTLVATMRREGEPAVVHLLTRDSFTLWGEGEARATRLTFDQDELLGALHAALGEVDRALGRPPAFATLEDLRAARRPLLTVRLLRAEDGPRPTLTVSLGASTRDEGASWLEDARRGARADDGWYALGDEHRRLLLDEATGFFREQEVTQPGGERFVLRCDAFRPGAARPAPTPPPVQEEVRPPVELVEELADGLFGPLAAQLAEAARASTPEEAVGAACRALVVVEGRALARQALRGLAREFVAAGDVAALRADPEASRRQFLAATEGARAELAARLARRVDELREQALEGVTDPARRQSLERALAASLSPEAVAAERADEAQAAALLDQELARAP